MHLAVVIPTYNESGNIERLINEILALQINTQIIVVDDNSPDGTGKIVDSISMRESKVLCIHRPSKLGLGTAHIAGMRHALELNCDAIITMDADFSHRPSYIPGLIAGFDRYDVVIGSRYVSRGGIRGRSLSLRLVSLVANLLARIVLGIKAADCTAGFRAYRNSVLVSINLDLIFSNGYSFLVELLFLCQTHGWRIGELPIIYEDRLTGKSKISRNEIYKAIYTVLRLTWRRLRTHMNKLLYRFNINQ